MKNLKESGFSSYCLSTDGDVFSLKSNRLLIGWVNVSGYRTLALTDDSGVVQQNVSLHRLVAKTFIENDDPENKTQVNHIDGNKLNNCVNNLEWSTPKDNTQHANDIGLRKPTFLTDLNKIPNADEIIHDWTSSLSYADVTEDEVHKVCSLLQEGYRVCDVSRMTAIDRRFIQALRDNDKLRWSNIVKTYDFSKIKRKEKTSPETVIEICKRLEAGFGVLEISRDLNVDRKLVGNIKGRKFHLAISSSFKF